MSPAYYAVTWNAKSVAANLSLPNIIVIGKILYFIAFPKKCPFEFSAISVSVYLENEFIEPLPIIENTSVMINSF